MKVESPQAKPKVLVQGAPQGGAKPKAAGRRCPYRAARLGRPIQGDPQARSPQGRREGAMSALL